MRDELRIDGDTWRVTTAPDDGRAVRTVVFHCVSNSQRPYRVVEVPADVHAGRSSELSEGELGELFARSQTMDFSHDAAAHPESHGYGDPPLG